MTHLLDTHAWIQRALGVPVPPLVDQTFIQYADSLALADISLWETAKLVELGRLKLSISLSEFFRLAISPELTVLPTTPSIAGQVTSLENTGFHKDPADQLIVATAITHGLCLISNDARIRKWGRVQTLWSTLRGE